MKFVWIAVLLLAVTAWSFSPTPVQKSQTELDLQSALDKAATPEEKSRVATEFLDSKPTDITAARLAQDALFKTLEDARAFFKARAANSESVVDHYLYARASADSTVMAQEATWILAKEPNNVWGHMLAGLAEWERATPDNAKVEQHFNDAIAADPSRPESYVNLGYLYQDMDKWPEAKAVFEAGQVVDPNNFSIQNGLVTVYATLRESDAYFKLVDAMLPDEPLSGPLVKANNGGGSVDAAKAFRGTVSLVEYWAYT